MSRAVHVYRLAVEVPPESLEPGWYPDDPDYRPRPSYYPETGEDDPAPFRWPARRLYLSSGAASARAAMLRRWGATVEIEKSRAVEW